MRVVVLILISFNLTLAGAQDDSLSNSVVWGKLEYGITHPFGVLAQRFGQGFGLGVGGAYLSQGGLFFGADYRLLFGNQVKEDVLQNLRTTDGGGIIGRDQRFAEVFLRQRGHLGRLEIGYFLGKKTMFRRSGLMLALGMGWLQHKIRIVDDFDAVVQVLPPNDRGYDRLTTGISIQQSIKYLYLSDTRLINFFIQLGLIQAFTKDRRGVAYYDPSITFGSRTDLMLSGSIGWIIPLYLHKKPRYY